MTTNLTMMRTAAAIAIAFLTLLLLPVAATAQLPDCDINATGADAAPYPIGRGDVLIGATVVTPNATIEIEGHDWSCNTTVEIVVTSPEGARQSLGTARVDAAGSFTTDVTFPADVSDVAGIEVIGTDSRGEARTASAPLDSLTLAAPIPALDVLTVAPAGNDITPYVLTGAILAALLASGVVVVARRQTI